jgi:hypothetical protein
MYAERQSKKTIGSNDPPNAIVPGSVKGTVWFVPSLSALMLPPIGVIPDSMVFTYKPMQYRQG